jgi:hypothetical protein
MIDTSQLANMTTMETLKFISDGIVAGDFDDGSLVIEWKGLELEISVKPV